MSMSSDQLVKVALIGCGTMMHSLFRHMGDFAFYLYNRTQEKAEALARENGGTVCQSMEDLPQDCSIYVIGLKPQNLSDIAPFLRQRYRDGRQLISLLAAKTCTDLEKECGWSINGIGRCMSNISSYYGLGIHVLYGAGISSSLRFYLHQSGRVINVQEEASLDSLAPLTGSGPAYVFELAKYLRDMIGPYLEKDMGGEKEDRQQELRSIIGQLLIGAGQVIKERKDLDFDELQSLVASKGGLTEQALKVLGGGIFRGEFEKAMERAMAQNKKLR